MSKVYVIWDNSNIHYGGLNQVFPIMEPNEMRELYRTHFMNLLKLVTNSREIGQVFFVGSTPPKSDSIWNYLEDNGIKPQKIPRAADGEWDTTDHLLQTHLLRLGYQPTPETVALLSGDGAGVNRDEGFFADLKRLTGKGWNVEVYSWEATCHQNLMKYAKEVGRYIKLDDYYFNVTFLEKKRAAKPLTL